MEEEDWACGVCLAVPAGQVHQCNEGHAYCAPCWHVISPRQCPECRQNLPLTNRCRAAERAIATLEATCEHCAEATTRGAMAAHRLTCKSVPAACTHHGEGCTWTGVSPDKDAHVAICPFVVGARAVAPLRAQLLTLTKLAAWQNVHLERANAHIVELCDRVGALEREREGAGEGAGEGAEGGEEAEGGGWRRVRRRLNHAGWADDMPLAAARDLAAPSDGEVEGMKMAEVVATLAAHPAVLRVARQACYRLANGWYGLLVVGSAAAEAGATEALLAAMRAHPTVRDVQAHACDALSAVCEGDATAGDEAAVGRARAHAAQQAAEAGALEAVAAAMRAHGGSASVQAAGCRALGSVCEGDDAAALARCKRATAGAGAIELVVAAMRAHRSGLVSADVQAHGCFALGHLCGGITDDDPDRETRSVLNTGHARTANWLVFHAYAGLKEVIAALQLYPDDGGVQGMGGFALRSMCRSGSGGVARRLSARLAGARWWAAERLRRRSAHIEQNPGAWVHAYGHAQALLDRIPAGPGWGIAAPGSLRGFW